MPTISTNGVETYYERRGDGPPIVFVHGAIVDLRQWEPQLVALSEEYTTIAYDVRGHGRTGGSARSAYSVELFADDLAALVEELDVERPVLCGLSLGGCIAQVYAARNPEAVSGLVLADTFAPEILSRSEWLQRSVLLRSTILPARLFGYPRVERAMVWFQERFQSEGVSGEYERVRALREEGTRMSTAEFAKVVRALVAFANAEVNYSAITVPTLVAVGENDAGFFHRHVAHLGTVISDATIRTVPDAGHVSNLDNPEFFTGMLQEYLADVGYGEATEPIETPGDAAGS